ncbi:ATP-dependent RNA helicase A [Pseudozyma hubeiensis SY62]|uniref:ATP-dependent RNA helicase A n=1 Tax=Pseudozyma hubeiensis (strain SY62) TaxID=1305764 RepID=R9PA21_PSEHS|nr:ATP-dependent RNA helicase A [Pseudozyma hubeiensis SY62]GAC94915.1 ATP-dependent RNA helicase A [Pseudozyma hubeiensis SY62]
MDRSRKQRKSTARQAAHHAYLAQAIADLARWGFSLAILRPRSPRISKVWLLSVLPVATALLLRAWICTFDSFDDLEALHLCHNLVQLCFRGAVALFGLLVLLLPRSHFAFERCHLSLKVLGLDVNLSQPMSRCA